MGSYVDLHIHSCYSDGLSSPKMLIETAKKNNVRVLSITDHDTIEEMQDINFNDQDIEIIPGIELSSFVNINSNEEKIHLLGYNFDCNNDELIELLRYLKDYRTKVNLNYLYQLKKIYTYLNNDMYFEVNCGKYCRLWKEIESYMKKANYTFSEIEDVKKYTLNNFPKYPNYDIYYKDVIRILKNAGGDIILAHPFSYSLNERDSIDLIYMVLEAGADGIEAYYSEYTREKIEKLVSLANLLDIPYTCGSDHHFPTYQNNKEIGYGIENNLCQEDCSYLQKKILKRR